MLPSFCNQTITRVRPSTKVVRGSSIFDWSDDKVNRLDIFGCSVQPATTSLSEDGRVLGINEQWTAYLPEGSDVKEGDRIEFEGDTYVINGAPKRWTAPLRLNNIQLNLSRWEG